MSSALVEDFLHGGYGVVEPNNTSFIVGYSTYGYRSIWSRISLVEPFLDFITRPWSVLFYRFLANTQFSFLGIIWHWQRL
jgi:hypothetical protein